MPRKAVKSSQSKAKSPSKAKGKGKAKSPSKAKSKAQKKVPALPQQTYTPSPLEIRNGERVVAILEKMEDIGFTVHRADLFTVEEPEFGLEIMVDAEEDVICLVAEVCNTAHLEKNIKNWAQELLRINNLLLHGAFAVDNGKVLLRENLAAQNLDANELEDALSAMFAGIIRYAHVLSLI